GLPRVKRVVGGGGATVACCASGGGLSITGSPVEEPYLRSTGPASLATFSASGPDGQLFLRGAERGSAQDSRVHLQDPGHR
ncbi:S26 family signal peptidase, partial [Streptomyces lavendulocolor]